MKFKTQTLINELVNLTKQIRADVEAFKKYSPDQLNHKSNQESWSALECLDHLVQYGDYYIPEMKQVLSNDSSQAKDVFKSGIIGNYFTSLMKPSDNQKKMKSPKDMVPRKSSFDMTLLDTFLGQQQELLFLLEQADKHDLGKMKCSISLSKFIKLKWGDTMRFVISHNHRHVEQAKRAIGGG